MMVLYQSVYMKKFWKLLGCSINNNMDVKHRKVHTIKRCVIQHIDSLCAGFGDSWEGIYVFHYHPVCTNLSGLNFLYLPAKGSLVSNMEMSIKKMMEAMTKKHCDYLLLLITI